MCKVGATFKILYYLFTVFRSKKKAAKLLILAGDTVNSVSTFHLTNTVSILIFQTLSMNESIYRFTESVELLSNLQSVHRNHYSINGIQS